MIRLRELPRRLWPWALILVVSLLAYLPAIRGGLIMDDAEHITPPALQGWPGLWRIWTDVGATPHYYPVLNSVFWIEHHLWGNAPVGYHLINVLQHALAAGLVVLLARRLGLGGALFAGLIFALHPVHVESVAWIAEQKNTLSTLLVLAATLVYFRYAESRRVGHYWAAFALFVLALLTKTVVAVAAPAILVILWWQHGRLDWRREVRPVVGWIGVGAALGLFSAWFEQVHSYAQGETFQVSWLERTLIAGRAVLFYVRTLVWPADLMFINPRWTGTLRDPVAYASLALVVLVGAGLVAVARKRRGPLAVYLLFVGMLFPVLGFLNINWFNFSWVANHFQYLPSLALIVPFAAVVTRWLETRPLFPGALQGVSAAAVILLAALTWSHARDYRSAQHLYAATVARNPECWLAHNNLGTILLDEPDGLPEALAHFQRALELKPDHARAHNNYATALLHANRPEEALEHYRLSLSLQEAVPEVHFNYAQALVQAGRADEALAEFARALALRPDYAEAELGRADLLAAMPTQRPQAIAAYHKAIRLNPALAEAYNNLGSLLGADATTEAEAITCLAAAVRLSPDYADARFNLGALLARQPGREAEAAAQFREVTRLRPDDVEAHLALAKIVARDPQRVGEAIEHARRVIALEPDNRDARALLSRLGAL